MGEVGVELESDVFHVDLAVACILAAVARMVGVGVEGEGSEEASLASAGFPAGVGMPFGTQRDGEETEEEQESAHGGSVTEASGFWGGKSAVIVGKIVPARSYFPSGLRKCGGWVDLREIQSWRNLSKVRFPATPRFSNRTSRRQERHNLVTPTK